MSITGVSTEGTTLKWGEAAASLTKVIDIKSFGDLGGTPNMLETTTMTDEAQTFISGILQNGEISFTCNFNKTTYAAVEADAGKQLNYELALGDNGDAGVFEWTGEHRIRFLGKDVDNVLEAEVIVAPSSLPKLKSEGAVQPIEVSVTSSIEAATPTVIDVVLDTAVTGLLKTNFAVEKDGSAYTDFTVVETDSTHYVLTMSDAAVESDVFTLTIEKTGYAFTGTSVTNNVTN